MFKRTMLAALAFSILAAPMAQAQSYRDAPRQGHYHVQPTKPGYKGHSRHETFKPAPKKKHHAWKRGHRFAQWKRHQQVRDYHRHGLRRPSHGAQWVRVDNNYLMISIATGVILAIANAR